MKPFALRARQRRRPTRSAAARRAAGRGVPRRRHEPRRPDAARRRATPDPLVDVTPARRTTAIERRHDGGLRIGAAVRNSDLAAHPLVRERYPMLAAGAAGRRVRAAAQHGHGRRQPAAAHPLRLLPGRHQAVQQARARLRLPGDRRASTATSRSSGTPSTASPPTRRTWRSRWPRSTRASRSPAPDGDRYGADRRAAPAARRARPTATPCSQPGELITARRAAASARGRRSTYRKVRDRASFAFALVSRRRRARRRPDGVVRDVPAGARRGGARAVARAAPPRRRCAAPPASRETFARAADAELADARPLPRQRVQGAAGPQPDRPLASSRGAASHGRRRRSTASRAREGHRRARRYAFEYPVDRRRLRPRRCRRRSPAAGSRAVDADAARSPCRACSRCCPHGNAPRLAAARTRAGAASRADRVAYRGQLVGRGRRRHARDRARGRGRPCASSYEPSRTTSCCARTTRGLYRPEKVNPALPTDTGDGDVDAALAGRGGRAWTSRTRRPRSTTTRWSRTPRSRSWDDDGGLTLYDSTQGAVRGPRHDRGGARPAAGAGAGDLAARRRRLRVEGHHPPARRAGGARRQATSAGRSRWR